jgi:replicative DNA helicase
MIQNNLNTAYEIPIDQENEALLLSNLLQSEPNRKSIIKRCKPDHFRQPEFYTIAWSIFELISEKLELQLDTILVKAQACPRRNQLTYDFLKNITTNYSIIDESSEKTVEYHVTKLIEDYSKQSVTDLMFKSVLKACMDPQKKVSDVREAFEKIQNKLDENYSAAVSEFKSLKVLVPEWEAERLKQDDFKSTGISQLDAFLAEGFKAKTVVTIAGGQGHGKSSLLLTMFRNLSNKQVYTGLFALEMNSMSIITKLISYNSNLTVRSITKHAADMNNAEIETYKHTLKMLANNPYMYINDKPQDLKGIKEQVMILQDALQTEYIPIAIDLWGKIKDLRGSKNYAQEYEDKLNITQEMAKDLNTCIINLAQIKRDSTTKKAVRPSLAELKNSGAFAEVSDLVLGIFRPGYDAEKSFKKEEMKMASLSYDEDMDKRKEYDIILPEDPNDNVGEILILKQRMEESNKIIQQFFDPRLALFRPLTREYQEQLSKQKLDHDGFQ